MEGNSREALIIGLGNPGKKYEHTRHNLGQRVLFSFAEKYQLSFKKQSVLKGKIARGIVKEKRVLLLFPITYINLSGQAVRNTIHFFKLSLEEILVLSDDIALPFGILRFRKKGRSGGHNGLKDIEDKLETQDYQRLRLGIGKGDIDCFKEHVLAPFTTEEKEKIPEIITQAVIFIEGWLFQKMKEHA